MVHRADPSTSHVAALEHTQSGARDLHCEVVLRLVAANAGKTASELAAMAPYDLQEVRRRLTDLKHIGDVRNGAPRRAHGRAKAEVTWWIDA